jgi:SecD/SecF fusion protein
MRNPIQLTILTVLLLAFSLAAIFPPAEKLRLGKDLAGGVSLIYSLDIDADAPPDVVPQTIDVLRDRVDPDGLFQISMMQMGRNRLEITMPLPSAKVQALRSEYEKALDELAQYELDVDAFERAMRATGTEQVEALRALGAKSEPLKTVIEPLVQAIQDAAAARFSAQMPGVWLDDTNSDPYEAAAIAEVAVEKARAELLDSVISRDQVRLAMTESREEFRVKRADKPGEIHVIPSDRDRSLNIIREKLKRYDGGEAALDRVLAAYDVYSTERRGYDDLNELQRLLQSSGVLQFRIAVRPGAAEVLPAMQALAERGPDAAGLEGVRWFRLNRQTDWFDDTDGMALFHADVTSYLASRYGLVGAEHNGQYYILLYDRPDMRLTEQEGDWGLASATPGLDEFGRPQINFEMDPTGARLLGRLTEPNQGQPMAILLDGKVFSAPTIQSALRRSARITGQFTQADINYIVRTLKAGSTQATLSERPISVNTLAPDLGTDNLQRGLSASYVSFIVVGVFMIVYYFSAGAIATFSMLCTGLLILGAMAAARSPFTMPGIAGIVLTFGMSVDANVLIYERMREELLRGEDLRVAVRIAFKRVLSTIVDANITTLIVCVVLGQTATQEIKGFAITLGVGVLATMFSALVITRLLFHFLVDVVKVRKMSQLPIMIPAIDRILTPRINWVGMRPIATVISVLAVAASLVLVLSQGNDLLDTEFRGGTSITVQLRKDENGNQVTLKRADVQERIRSSYDRLQAEASAGDASAARLVESLSTLAGRSTTIVPINPEADGVTSGQFTIRTQVEDENALQQFVTRALAGDIDAQPALEFTGYNAGSLAEAPVYQIFEGNLGEALGRPEIRNDVSSYVGGAAILIENIEPAVSRETLLDRLQFVRSRADFAEIAASRRYELITLEGDNDSVRSAVLVVADRGVDIYNEPVWRSRLAQVEWDIVQSALAQPTTLATVEKFSAAIAATFRAQATVATLLSLMLILIYIRLRFGSLRYSLAAVIGLIHTVIVVVGLVALSSVLYDMVPAARVIGIQPFRFDLTMVAALLTVIGYALNDTIVILDRIRENRGKLPYTSKETVNNSINQTFSRSVITSGTTLFAVLVLFIGGSDAIAGFAFALLSGVIVGTYSSVAIAAPMVVGGRGKPGGRAATASESSSTPVAAAV